MRVIAQSACPHLERLVRRMIGRNRVEKDSPVDLEAWRHVMWHFRPCRPLLRQEAGAVGASAE